MVTISNRVTKPMAVIAAGLILSLVVVPTCQVASAAGSYGSSDSHNWEGAAVVVGGAFAIYELFIQNASASGTAAGATAADQMTALTQHLTDLQGQLAATTDPAAQESIQKDINATQGQIDQLIKDNPQFAPATQ